MSRGREKAERARTAKIAARSLYREFVKAGLEEADVVAAATELLACVSETFEENADPDQAPVSLDQHRATRNTKAQRAQTQRRHKRTY